MVMVPLDKVQALARQAQFANAAHQPLEVPADIAAGRVKTFDSMDDLLADLEQQP